MATSTNFNLDFLKHVKVDSIPLQRSKVFILSSKESVLNALSLLESNGILSAPVWDDETGQFIGSMDLHHIVQLIASEFSYEELSAKKHKILMEKRELFTKKPIKDIFDFGERNPFHKLSINDTLYDAVHSMVGGGAHVRRSLVFKDDVINKENLVSLLSQAALVTYIAQNINKLGDLCLSSVADVFNFDWDVSRQSVVAVDANQKVSEAFRLMAERNISGVAVVSTQGLLIGTIGIRDLKGLMHGDGLDLSRLQLNIRAFLNVVQQMSLDEKHPAISIRRNESFATLLNKFASTRVHRLFVVDEDSMPIAVISIFDVLQTIINHKG